MLKIPPIAHLQNIRSNLRDHKPAKKKMTNINIKKVTLHDIDQLQKIGRQTFYETFSAGNTEENMKKYLDEGFSIKKLTAELNDRNAEFYFATLDNNTIGYLKLNFGTSQTELQDDKALEIERIYVLKDFFHGKNVGQLLYDKAIQVARQKNADYVWLGIWGEKPEGDKLLQEKRFRRFDKHIFKLGNDEQTGRTIDETRTWKERKGPFKPDVETSNSMADFLKSYDKALEMILQK